MQFVILNLFFLGAALLFVSVLIVADRRQGEAMRIRRGHAILRQAVRSTILNYEQSTIFSALVPAVIFAALPGAALLNAFLGGSSFFILCYLTVFIAVSFLLLIGECAWFDGVRIIMSGLVAFSSMVMLPGYAVWTLTKHIQSSLLAQAALASIVIAVILAATMAGVWTLIMQERGDDTPGPVLTFVATMLFALSPGYVAFWFVLLIFSVFEHEFGTMNGWPDLITFVVSASIAFALFMAFLDKLVPALTQGRKLPAVLSAGMAVLVFVMVLALE